MPLDESTRSRALEVARRVLEEIGPECQGVMYTVDDVPTDGNVPMPALILRWDPKIHPKTIHDPAQAIVLENVRTGQPIKVDTLRRVMREKIEHMLKCDSHAHKEFYPVGSLSLREGRDQIEKALEADRMRSVSEPLIIPSR